MSKQRLSTHLTTLAAFVLTLVGAVVSRADSYAQDASVKQGYAIVASSNVLNDSDWSQVVDSLKAKREGEYSVATFEWSDKLLDELKEARPKYICFVFQPTEATKERVVEIWRLTRQLDDDPYGDAIWGIVTGAKASDALRLTKTEDCAVETAVGATSIPLEYFKSGIVFDEGRKNHRKVKEEGKDVEDLMDAPDDTTHAISDALNGAQLFVTSGHASEQNWSIGYSYKNGFFVAKDEKLLGVPSNDKPYEITAEGSKIQLASGNCLWGNITGTDCMALAMIGNANVDMFMGYIVTTWFGYMGWGTLDYYLEQPGRFTVAEAVFANNQALLNLLENKEGLSPQYVLGLQHDRDVVALYGDPAWRNPLSEQKSGWSQTLTSEQTTDGRTQWTLTITPLKGKESFSLIDGNGSERGGRPIFQFFPYDVEDPQIVDACGLPVVATENFILAPIKNQEISTDAPTVIKVTTK